MAAIQRRVHRLGVRRRRQLLSVDRRPFSGLRLSGEGWTEPLLMFAVVGVVTLGLDVLVASIIDGPAYLGTRGAMIFAFGATATVVGGRRVAQWLSLPTVQEPKALQAAVEEEMRVAGEQPTELERIDIVATRGWFWMPSGAAHLELLVLDCGSDGVVCLRGRALRAISTAPVGAAGPLMIPGRFSIESLRWTHAVLGLSTRGAAIPITQLEDEHGDALESQRQCEVFTAEQLSPALAAIVQPKALAYR